MRTDCSCAGRPLGTPKCSECREEIERPASPCALFVNSRCPHGNEWRECGACGSSGFARSLERELTDIRDMYYGLKEDHEIMVGKNGKLLDALKGIASGLYSWQCCVDEIAPQAVADFYSENDQGRATSGAEKES